MASNIAHGGTLAFNNTSGTTDLDYNNNGVIVATNALGDLGGSIISSSGTGQIVIGSAGTIELDAGVSGNSIGFGDNTGLLVIEQLGNITPSVKITGLQSGDLIDLPNLPAGFTETYDPTTGTLVIDDVSGAQLGSLVFGGSQPASKSTVLAAIEATAFGAGGPPCYAIGTRIKTTGGDIEIDKLAIGDQVITASGAARPIKWIGRRNYAGRFIAGRRDILPILIRAGALGAHVPRRDLRVSPKHALFIDDVLVPADLLVNGKTIVQVESIEFLAYFHIELDTHDIILAEDAPAESFLDCDSRAIFQNADEFYARYPQEAGPDGQFCADRIEDGAFLAAIRRRLAGRAGLAADHIADEAMPGELDGRIDSFSHDGVSGWACDLRQPRTAVRLQILVNGRPVGEVVANRHRADLEQAGKAQGRCAFEFRFPAPLPANKAHILGVVRCDDQSDLPGSPSRLPRQPARPGPLAGRIDNASHAGLEGWAFDAAHPAIAVLLEVMDGETVLGRVLADQPRSDLARAGFGGGRCAFSYRFAPPLSADVRHRLWLRRHSDKYRVSAAETILETLAAPTRSRRSG